MKKFAFSLQRLLDYTRQLLDIERATLADMNAVLRNFRSELELMKAEYARRAAEFEQLKTEGMTPLDMRTHVNYLRKLDEDIHDKTVQIEMQQKVVDKQTDKVRGVNIEISTMDNLRERKLEEYNYLDNKEQELFIEEFVSNKKATVG